MIEMRNLQKVVEQVTTIDILELVAMAGEVTAVFGLTGLEKKTFIELLTGQTRPTAGEVRLAGLDPFSERKAFAMRVGLLPAENGLYPKLSVRQNLTFYANLYGVGSEHCDQILQKVGLQDQASERAGNLAPSLARRLALGRSVLHHPSVWLLIEPFANCDATSTALLKNLISEMANQGTTIFMIASDRAQILSLCNLVVEMENGRLAQQYRPAEQTSQSDLPFKIPARLEGKVALVNPADILYATAEDGRTFLCTNDGNIPTHLTLSEVEERLARSGFFRAHRAYLVNIQHIKEVISYTRNSYTLVLDGTTPDNGRIEIPLSKSAARDLREMLDY
jgi:ABC-2 type transport system ATP-binding protein